MASNNGFGLIIQAKLDEVLSTSNIQSQLNRISKELNLKLTNIGIDGALAKTLGDITKNLDNVRAIVEQSNRVLEQTTTITQSQDGAIKKVTQSRLADGHIISKTIDDLRMQTIAVEQQAEQVRKLASDYENIGKAISKVSTLNMFGQTAKIFTTYQSGNTKTTVNANGQNEVSSVKIADNLKADEQQTRALIQAKEELRQKLVDLARQGTLTSSDIASVAKMMNTSSSLEGIKQAEKEYQNLATISRTIQQNRKDNAQLDAQEVKKAEQIQKENALIERQLELYKQETSIRVQNLMSSSLGGTVDQSGLNAWKATIEQLQTANFPSLTAAKQKLEELNLEFKQITANAKSASGATTLFGNAVSSVAGHFAMVFSGAILLMKFVEGIREGITYTNELNSSFTQIELVTGKTNDQIQKLNQNLRDTANNMSLKTKDVVDMYTTYYKRGLNDQQTAEMADSTKIYSTISNLDPSQSAEILTAAVNSMHVSVKKVIDDWSILSSSSAASADELGTAFQKVGSAANAVGLNFEKVNSWIATVESTTRQSPENIGNAFNSLLARFQNLKEKGFDQLQDGSVNTANQVDKSLHSIGISLINSQGQFNDLGSVMDQLGAKWGTLDSAQRAYISTTVAGTYQANKFESLMNNYGQSISLYNKELNDSGVAQQRYSVWLDSTQAHLNKLSNAETGIWQDAFDSKDMKNNIDTLTGILNTVDSVVRAFGVLPPVLMTASLAFGVLSKSGRAFSLFVGELMGTTPIVQSAMARIESSLLGVGVSANTTGLALKGFKIALGATGVGLALVAVGEIVSHVVGAYEQASAAADEAKRKLDESTDAYMKNSQQIDKAASTYETLSIKGENNLNTSELKDYTDAVQKLSQLMPDFVDSIDSQGNAHLQAADAIKIEIGQYKELAYHKALAAVDNLNSSYQSNKSGLSDAKEKLDAAKNRLETYNKNPEAYIDDRFLESNKYLLYGAMGENSQVGLNLVSQLSDAQKNYDALTKSSNDDLKDALTTLLGFADGMQTVDDTTKQWVSDLAKAKDLQSMSPDQLKGYEAQLNNTAKAMAEIDNQVQAKAKQGFSGTGSGLIKEQSDFIQQLTDKATAAKAPLDWLNKLIHEYFNITTDGSQSTYDFSGAADSIYTETNKASAGVKDLNDAIGKTNSGQRLSRSEIDALVQKYPALRNSIQVVNGVETLRTEELIKQRGIALQSTNDFLDNKQKEIQAAEQQALDELKAYGVRTEAVNTYADAVAASAKIADTVDPNADNDANNRRILQKSKEVEDNLKKIVDAKDQLKNALSEMGAGFVDVGNGASAGSQKLTELENSINGVDNALADLQNRMEGINQHSVEYRQGLQQEIDLLDKKEKLLQKQINNPSAGWSDLNGTSTASTSTTSGYSGQYGDTINKAASQYGVDPRLVAAVIQQESGFNPNAISGVGAQGLMQLMPDTANELGVTNAFDATQNIMAGTKYLAEQIKAFGGDIRLGLAAYNAGAGNARNAINNVAETKNYVNSIMSNYSGSGTPLSADASNADDLTKKVSDHIQKNKAEIAKLNTQEQQLRMNIVKDMVGQYDDVSAEYDDKVKISQVAMQGYDKSSKEYVGAINDQINALKERQYVAHVTADYIRGTDFANTPEMQKKIRDLQLSYQQLGAEIKKLKQDALDSGLDYLDSKIGDIDLNMKKLDVTIQANKDKNVGYNSSITDSLDQQIVLMEQKQAIYQQEADAIKNSGLLTEDNIKKMEQLQGSILDMQSQIEQKQKEIADSIVQVMKNAIQQEIKAEDERHQEVTKNLDAEQKQFEEQINSQIKAIDRQKSTDDYNDNLKKEQQARQKIQDELNALSMDSSDDAKSKRADLTKQLADQDDKIAKMQKDHETELRKQNLQDQLDAYKKDIEAKKQAEDDKYNATKNKLQDQLDDEQHWADVTQKIMDGNVSSVQSEMKKLVNGLDSYATSNANIVNAHINTIKSSIAELQKAMNDLNGVSITNGSGGSNSTLDAIKQRIAQLGQDWQTATNQKDKDYYHVQAVELASQNGGIWNSGTNSYDWVDKSKMTLNQVKEIISQLQDAYKIAVLQSDKDQLHNIAGQLASLYGGKYTNSGWVFPTSTARLITGGETPMWGSQGKVAILDQGEIIHNQEDSKSLKSVFSFTKKISEALLNKGGSLLAGIVQGLGLDNIAGNIMPTVATPSALNPSQYTFNSQSKEGDSHVTNYIDLIIHAKDGTDASSKIVNGLKKQGIKFNTR